MFRAAEVLLPCTPVNDGIKSTHRHNTEPQCEEELLQCFPPTLLSVSPLQMTLLEGNLAASGGFAYVSQQAWVLNESLKENILFGSEYDQDK